MRKSKQLVDTNGGATQTFTNTLLNNGTPVTAGAAYSITEKPADLTNQITVNPATGVVTFGAAALTKVNSDGPQTVTIQAAYQGTTASYTFTVTDHFSPRRYHASAVLGTTLYVIAGSESSGAVRDIWESTDLGATWTQVATGTRFSARRNHSAVVLDGAIYVIGGLPRDDEVWRSADQGVTWTQVATGARFSARHEHTSAALSSAFYVIGGFDGTNRLNDVWKSTDQGVTWTNVHA